jgi:hypothetical protein
VKTTIFLFITIVGLPLVCGAFIYAAAERYGLRGFWRNQLADGLWAFALLSSLLITWNGRLPKPWWLAAMALPVVYEVLQWTGLAPGTGDLLDLFAYALFYGFASGAYRILSYKKFQTN